MSSHINGIKHLIVVLQIGYRRFPQKGSRFFLCLKRAESSCKFLPLHSGTIRLKGRKMYLPKPNDSVIQERRKGT